MQVTKETILERDLQLTENIDLNLLTIGSTTLDTFYKHDIRFTNHLYDRNDEWNIPQSKPLISEKWKIVRNLQVLSERIIEPLIDEYKDDLILVSAFIDPTINNDSVQNRFSRHYVGEALDFSVKNFESNMLPLIPDIITKFAGEFVEIGFICNQTTWVHIGISAEYSSSEIETGNPLHPIVYTKDMSVKSPQGGELWSGLFPARGVYVY